jgi:DNA gyrase/topoisomerase IV subunit A
MDEQDFLSKIKSPWVVELKASFQEGDYLFLVMEFLQGGDLMNLLIKKHLFNEEQAKAILAMKLSSLTRLDIVKLTNEQAQLVQDIEKYQHLLNTPSALDEELIKSLEAVSIQYGDPRRTSLQNTLAADTEVELPQEKEVGIMLFDNDILRIVEKDELQGGKRGRKGVNIKPPKNANLMNTLYRRKRGTYHEKSDHNLKCFYSGIFFQHNRIC